MNKSGFGDDFLEIKEDKESLPVLGTRAKALCKLSTHSVTATGQQEAKATG